MSIICQKDGILTTIQDLGRLKYRRLGINPGGVMDPAAARLLNILVGNDENEAVMELHFPAGEFIFESGTVFAVGGADFEPLIDGSPLHNWKSSYAEKGAKLSFGQKGTGNRTYLAVAGGFRIKKWLESLSTNLIANAGGLEGRRIRKGDRIELNMDAAPEPRTTPLISRSLIPAYSRFPTVRILRGAEYDLLTSQSQKTILNEAFTITNDSNRTGYRIKGVPLSLAHRIELVSSAVGFGTVQLLPDGQMIILMADHQTTGGYPRVGHIVSRDLPLVAQLGGGDRIAFELVSVADAEVAAAEFEEELRWLKIGRRLAQW